jgi:hypothetical protein
MTHGQWRHPNWQWGGGATGALSPNCTHVSFVRKKAPIVALVYVVYVPSMYRCTRHVLPTPAKCRE